MYQDFNDLNSDGVLKNKIINVFVACFWTTPSNLINDWKKMSKDDLGRWENIQLVDDEKIADYTCIFNYPNCNINNVCDRIILYHMEPLSFTSKLGELSDPPLKRFKSLQIHKYTHNNVEWHISSSYTQLINNEVNLKKTKGDTISVILSNQYTNLGHRLRIDFAKYLDNNSRFTIEHYGKGGNPHNFKNHTGELPYMHKDEGLYPYKYTFNAENHSEYNYFTEKITDAILSETLCFYWGCPNIHEYINPNAYVVLDLANNSFEECECIIKQAIDEDWYSQRISYIREAKIKILNELQFFPTLHKILNE